MEKNSTEDFKEKIIANIVALAKKKFAYQTDFVNGIKKYKAIDKSKVSKWYNGKSNSISIDEIIAVSKVFDVNPEDIICGRLSDEFSLIHPQKPILGQVLDNILKPYMGTYFCYFLSTITRERNKLLTGELYLSNEENRPKAEFVIKLDSGRNKNYFGWFSINKSLDAVYCILQGEDSGDISFLNFKYIKLPDKPSLYKGGMAAVLTTSAGGTDFLPTFHKLFISKEKIKKEGLDTVKSFLLLSTEQIYIMEDEYEKFKEDIAKDIDITFFDEVIQKIEIRAKKGSYYCFNETNIFPNDGIDKDIDHNVFKYWSELKRRAYIRKNIKVDNRDFDLISDLFNWD